MTGFNSKREAAADKLQESKREALKLALVALEESQTDNDTMEFWDRKSKAITAIKAALAQPAQEPEMLTIAYQSGYHDGKQAALAGREWNFCERCGKRTADLTIIHTCTPPQGAA
jgi:hypothetical protein